MPLQIDKLIASSVDAQSITLNGNSVTPKYKVYTALLTQTGTDAPIATVLENTLGDIVWVRNDVGDYLATSLGFFIEDKTYYTIFNNSNPLQYDLYFTTTGDINTLNIYSYFNRFPADEAFYYTPIEIRVYN